MKQKTKFYHFQQNNSGGIYLKDIKKGICENVIIEAKNSEEANDIAEKIGLYFYGVANDIDCECCGDRWSRVDEYQGEDKPTIYGETLDKHTYSIHYLNGTRITI